MDQTKTLRQFPAGPSELQKKYQRGGMGIYFTDRDQRRSGGVQTLGRQTESTCNGRAEKPIRAFAGFGKFIIGYGIRMIVTCAPPNVGPQNYSGQLHRLDTVITPGTSYKNSAAREPNPPPTNG